MLTVTAQAAEKLKEALEQEGKPNWGLRLIAQAGGCNCCGPSYGLFPEKESQPNDTVISEGGVKLFIDPASMTLLKGATIDFVDHPQYGQGFTIENPNFNVEPEEGEGGCGCQG